MQAGIAGALGAFVPRAVFYALSVLYAVFCIFIFTHFPPLSISLLLKTYLPVLAVGFLLVVLFRKVHYDVLDSSTVPVPESLRGKITARHTYLIHALHSVNPTTRRASIEALVESGRDVLPALFFHAREEGDVFREAVLEVVRRVHPHGLITALTEALEDDGIDDHTLWQLCKVLRDLRAAASPAVPALIQVLRKRGPFSNADDALAAIGRESVVPLVQVLLDRAESAEVRWRAAITLRDCFCSPTITKAEIDEVRKAYQQVADNAEESSEMHETARECLNALESWEKRDS